MSATALAASATVNSTRTAPRAPMATALWRTEPPHFPAAGIQGHRAQAAGIHRPRELRHEVREAPADLAAPQLLASGAAHNHALGPLPSRPHQHPLGPG